jgi:hypothetical protein
VPLFTFNTQLIFALGVDITNEPLTVNVLVFIIVSAILEVATALVSDAHE